MLTIINIFIDTKKEINYSYQDMMDLVNRAKEKEKDDITRKLKDLTDEERAINNEFKKHKLGDWGLGLQKGLTQYVADFYDREIEENEAKLREEERRLAIQAEEELIENEEKLVDSIVDRIVFICVLVYES